MTSNTALFRKELFLVYICTVFASINLRVCWICCMSRVMFQGANMITPITEILVGHWQLFQFGFSWKVHVHYIGFYVQVGYFNVIQYIFIKQVWRLGGIRIATSRCWQVWIRKASQRTGTFPAPASEERCGEILAFQSWTDPESGDD